MAIKVVLGRNATGGTSGEVTYADAGFFHVDGSGHLHIFRDASRDKAYGSHAPGKWDSVYEIDRAIDKGADIPRPVVG